MKILVTGGLGVVGTPLVKELRERGHDVWVCDQYLSSDPKYIKCDIGMYRQVEHIFEEQSFELVYNLAAEFGRMNGEHFYENLWQTNVVGLKNIIKNQEKYKFRLVHFSSSEVYGDYQGLMTEDVLEKYPIRQLNDYAITKWVNEQQVMNAANRSGIDSVRVRLFNTFGPGEYYSPYRSATTIFIYHALHEMPYDVYLNHHRSPTYIDDCVSALANITDNFKPGEVYNICSSEYYSIKDMSDMILEYIGIDDSLVNYITFEEHNTLNKRGDNTKARQDLGYETTVSMREGLARNIEWQKQVYASTISEKFLS